MISRRIFLAAGAGISACTRKRNSGFGGYAFVANEEGQAIAAVDLSAFAVIRHVRVNGKPTDVVSARSRSLTSVYALTPANGTVHEIPTDNLAVRNTLSRGSLAQSMRIHGRQLLVLYRSPRRLSIIGLDHFRPERDIHLAGDPYDFDIAAGANIAAVSYGREGRLSLIDLESGSTRMIDANTEIGILRFQSDGRALIAADLGRRMLLIYDVESVKLITRLPLAVRPDNLCFNADGGQLFVTGEGMDAVVVVYPYHTPQVAETVLAGRAPGTMAATNTQPAYLFIANPDSGEVSIMNIGTRRMVAVAAVGADPRFIAITPDQQYALVLNRQSGDMGVIRIHANIGNRQKSAGLLTMIPVGSKPVSAAIRAV